MTKIIHPVAGAIAILTIATFWLSTALSELFATQAVVTAVKTTIPWGFLLLIPALAAAGGSGLACTNRSATTIEPTRPRRCKRGWRSTHTLNCTLFRPRRPGSILSSGCSPKSPASASGAACSRAYRSHRRHQRLVGRAQHQAKALQVDGQSRHHPAEKCPRSPSPDPGSRDGYQLNNASETLIL